MGQESLSSPGAVFCVFLIAFSNSLIVRSGQGHFSGVLEAGKVADRISFVVRGSGTGSECGTKYWSNGKLAFSELSKRVERNASAFSVATLATLASPLSSLYEISGVLD